MYRYYYNICKESTAKREKKNENSFLINDAA